MAESTTYNTKIIACNAKSTTGNAKSTTGNAKCTTGNAKSTKCNAKSATCNAKSITCIVGTVVVVNVCLLDLQLSRQSAPITTNVVRSNPIQVRCTRYNIM